MGLEYSRGGWVKLIKSAVCCHLCGVTMFVRCVFGGVKKRQSVCVGLWLEYSAYVVYTDRLVVRLPGVICCPPACGGPLGGCCAIKLYVKASEAANQTERNEGGDKTGVERRRSDSEWEGWEREREKLKTKFSSLFIN